MTRKINLHWNLGENEKTELLIKRYHFTPAEILKLNKSQLKKILLIMNGR